MKLVLSNMSTASSRRNSTTSSTLPPPSPSLTSGSSNGKSLSISPPKSNMRSPKMSNNLVVGSPVKFSSTRRSSSARYKSSLTNSSGSTSPSGSAWGRSCRRTSVSSSSGEQMSRDEEIAYYSKFRKDKVGSVSLANIFIDEAGSSSRENGASSLRGIFLWNSDLFRVLVLGSEGSGKSSLISQFTFQSEEHRSLEGNSGNKKFQEKNRHFTDQVPTYLQFHETSSFDECLPHSPITLYQPDAYIVIFSLSDRQSFEACKDLLMDVQKWDDIELKPVILVANKSDLVRSRAVPKQEGRQLALDTGCKYIEVSCTFSMNIDVLLAGIASQLGRKNSNNLIPYNSNKMSGSSKHGGHPEHKQSFIKRLLNKALYKSKSCDNLSVL